MGVNVQTSIYSTLIKGVFFFLLFDYIIRCCCWLWFPKEIVCGG